MRFAELGLSVDRQRPGEASSRLDAIELEPLVEDKVLTDAGHNTLVLYKCLSATDSTGALPVSQAGSADWTVQTYDRNGMLLEPIRCASGQMAPDVWRWPRTALPSRFNAVTLNAEHELRQASAVDVAAIAACVQRAYAKYADRLSQPPKPVLADYAAVVRSRPTWLLEQSGQCVGVLVLVPQADHLLLENVAVDPAHQGRGLGRLLLDFTEAEALRLGLPAVRLYTNARMTENVAIYAARGYVETERREIDGRTAVFMQKSVTAPR